MTPAGRPHVERLGVMELPGDDGGDCARFLANQLLTWRFARPDPPCAEPVGYSAELTRGRRYAATGLWVPDAGGFVDVAYLDPDCGGVEWELGTHTAAVTRLPAPDSTRSGPRLLRQSSAVAARRFPAAWSPHRQLDRSF